MKRHTFNDYWKALSMEERKQLAKDAGTSYQYLYQLSAGIRKPGAAMCAMLKAADNRISDSLLRPDLYQ